MRGFLRVLRDLGLLVARVVAGVTLMARGWHRWQVTGLDAQEAVLRAAGLPNPEVLALAAVAFELIGGVLLVFGLATPLVGLGMVAVNVAVILTTRADAGFYQHGGGWEYNAAQAALGLVFLVFGAGRTGLDHLFVRPRDDHDRLIADPRDAQLAHS